LSPLGSGSCSPRKKEVTRLFYIGLSLAVLAIGIYGLLSKRSFIKILISIELIASAAAMNFVIFSSSLHDPLGEAFMILTLTVDTCITGVALALAVAIRRRLGTVDVGELARLGERG